MRAKNKRARELDPVEAAGRTGLCSAQLIVSCGRTWRAHGPSGTVFAGECEHTSLAALLPHLTGATSREPKGLLPQVSRKVPLRVPQGRPVPGRCVGPAQGFARAPTFGADRSSGPHEIGHCAIAAAPLLAARSRGPNGVVGGKPSTSPWAGLDWARRPCLTWLGHKSTRNHVSGEVLVLAVVVASSTWSQRSPRSQSATCRVACGAPCAVLAGRRDRNSSSIPRH